jgi:hypothetical protein
MGRGGSGGSWVMKAAGKPEIEARIAGTPPIVRDRESIRDQIQNAENGRVLCE